MPDRFLAARDDAWIGRTGGARPVTEDFDAGFTAGWAACAMTRNEEPPQAPSAPAAEDVTPDAVARAIAAAEGLPFIGPRQQRIASAVLDALHAD